MFSPNLKRFALLVALVLPALSACTGKEVRSTFGMKRNNPDAFQVVSRPPLSVPPVYHLRPPSEEMALNLTPAHERAEALVFQGREVPVYKRPEDSAYQSETAVTSVETSELGSSGDSLFLQNAGAEKAQADIRSILNKENAPLIIEEKQEKGLLESVTSKLRPGKGDPVVDAQKEQARLRTNKAEGKPLNEGETPVIDPKKESVLDRLL